MMENQGSQGPGPGVATTLATHVDPDLENARQALTLASLLGAQLSKLLTTSNPVLCELVLTHNRTAGHLKRDLERLVLAMDTAATGRQASHAGLPREGFGTTDLGTHKSVHVG